MATETATRTPGPTRQLRVRSALRLRQVAAGWHRPALSAVIALGAADLVLLALGRLDLALYTSGGGLCALYAHGLPYAARARTLGWVVLSMTASVAIALTTAASTDSTVVRVAVAALLAAVHKMLCDATRIGPPANLIPTFIAASCVFVPQRLADVPAHLALTLAAGAFAWLVCMAPALLRPQGPQRHAVARALEAAAGQGAPAARAATAAAAWRTVLLVPARSTAAVADRGRLELLLIRAGSGTAEPGQLRLWAGALRSRGPLPDLSPTGAETAELADLDAVPGAGTGAGVERSPSGGHLHRRAPLAPGTDGRVPLLRALRPGSPLLTIGARVALGCALAGWASMELGVGRPYWAVVTAASVFQANTVLSWNRALNRVLGNVIGLVLFAVLLPLTGLGAAVLVLAALACQFATEATISRGYWLASVFVTPMSLLMVQFAQAQPAGELIADRALDTVVGAAVGLACCFLITDRHVSDRAERALAAVAATRAEAARLLDAPARQVDRYELGWARDRLTNALVELREAADTAGGEWRQRTLPEDRISAAEQRSHPVLAELSRRLDPALRGLPTAA
ncbi:MULTISPECIES: FUSC family protein [Streptacidiphilus]|uniref:FUSC family protein n=1 Tax=Streptacidiphilus cavernicola TaxID=3342716 RepID=A0ABV6ULS7_9ACTN|nr:FUSC family protein [Streptacidiphilus jeojiense]